MLQSVIELIHASPAKFCLSLTGAGGNAIASLLSVPGCSNTLLHADVPYAAEALYRLVGHSPRKCLSIDVARQLAQRAYRNALSLHTAPSGDNKTQLFGVGLTAAIATNRTRKGEDAVHLCVWGGFDKDVAVTDTSITLSRGYSREEGERLVTCLVIKSMATAIGNVDTKAIDLMMADMGAVSDAVQCRRWGRDGVALIDPVVAVLSGASRYALFNQFGDVRMSEAPFGDEAYRKETTQLLYPGSFRPLHWGHTELAKAASRVAQRKQNGNVGSTSVSLTYEISTTVVDKSDLSETDLRDRLSQFRIAGYRVAITSASKLFIEKAQLFPNHGFVVGIDTARRILDPKYYNNSVEEMTLALLDIKALGCYFVVGGRKDQSATEGWDDLSKLDIPITLQEMFVGIDANEFRVDISSTELREIERKSSSPK